MANLPPDRRIQLQANTGTNVINGAAGTAQPTATPNQPQQGQQGLTTNTQGAAPQQAQNTPQRSSGMFTNIKSYIQRNQPQAQKMASAVTGDFSKQATQIADQAKQREQQFKSQVQAQQGNIQAQKDFATGMIDQTKNLQLGEGQMANAETLQNIYANKPQQIAPAPVIEGQQPAPQQISPTPEEIAKQSQENYNKFQNIITGANEQDLYNVRDLDLSRQQNKAQQLGALAKSAGTEQGRAALLDQAFSKNKQYTIGQAGLDTAILGGNQQALQNVKDLTKQSTQGIEKDLKQKYFQSLSDRANLQKSAEQVKTDVAGQVESAMGDVVKQAEQTAEEKKQVFKDTQGKVQRMLRGEEPMDKEFLSKYVDSSDFDKSKKRSEEILRGIKAGTAGSGSIAEMFGSEKSYKAFRDDIAEKASKSYKMSNAEFKALQKDPSIIEAARQRSNAKGVNFNSDELSGYVRDFVLPQKRKEAGQQAVQDKLQNMLDKSYNSDIYSYLQSKGDMSGLANLADTSEFTAQNMASEDQLARYEALKRLSNKTGVGALDMMKDRYKAGKEATIDSANLYRTAARHKNWLLGQ